jgi:hypothetical protein
MKNKRIILICLLLLLAVPEFAQINDNKFDLITRKTVYEKDTLLSYLSFTDAGRVHIDFRFDSVHNVSSIFYTTNRKEKQISIDYISSDTAIVYVFTKTKNKRVFMQAYLNDELIVSGRFIFNTYKGKWKEYNNGEIIGYVVFDKTFVASENGGASGKIKKGVGKLS